MLQFHISSINDLFQRPFQSAVKAKKKKKTLNINGIRALIKLNELKLNKSECVESQLTKNILNKLFLCLYLQ